MYSILHTEYENFKTFKDVYFTTQITNTFGLLFFI